MDPASLTPRAGPQQPHCSPLGPPVSPDTARPHTGHCGSSPARRQNHGGSRVFPKIHPYFQQEAQRGENLEGNWAQSNAALPQVPWNNRRPGCHGSITAMECGWCPMDHEDGSSKEVLGPHTAWTRGVSTPPNQP